MGGACGETGIRLRTVQDSVCFDGQLHPFGCSLHAWGLGMCGMLPVTCSGKALRLTSPEDRDVCGERVGCGACGSRTTGVWK